MHASTIQVEAHLLGILKKQEFDGFTVVQLRDAFWDAIGGCSRKSKSDVRRWIYQRLLRLVAVGMLEKHEAKSARDATYQKTDAFWHGQFTSVTLEWISTPSGQISDSSPLPNALTATELDALHASVKQYHVDLQASIAEADEYIRLVDEFPSLREKLTQLHDQAQQRNTELLGKLNAVKAILSSSQRNSQ